MRISAGLCNINLHNCIEIVINFLFLVKNIFYIYLTFVILRLNAFFNKSQTNY